MPSDQKLTGEDNFAGIGKGLRRMVGILWIVLVVLLVLWFLGFIASVDYTLMLWRERVRET